jgi:flagellin-like hook-associated protein FlgL
MYINTDLATDNLALALPQKRSEAGAIAPQPSSGAASGSAASQLDPSLQRLTEVPVGIQDAQWEIQDEQGAGQAVAAAQQGMSQQPGVAMSAQGNQLYQNVLSLLQPTD